MVGSRKRYQICQIANYLSLPQGALVHLVSGLNAMLQTRATLSGLRASSKEHTDLNRFASLLYHTLIATVSKENKKETNLKWSCLGSESRGEKQELFLVSGRSKNSTAFQISDRLRGIVP